MNWLTSAHLVVSASKGCPDRVGNVCANKVVACGGAIDRIDCCDFTSDEISVFDQQRAWNSAPQKSPTE
jgi:hypothetical protein